MPVKFIRQPGMSKILFRSRLYLLDRELLLTENFEIIRIKTEI